jgi:LPS export ABC transporter protein LptC
VSFRRSIILWCIPALVAGMLVSCTNDLDKVAAVAVSDDAPDRVTHQAEYLYTDAGRPRYRLQAGRIDEWTKDPQRYEITDGLKLQFFDSVGAPGSTLTARRGVILTQEKRMEVYEEVVFINVKGERMETEKVVWYQDSARIFTDKAVRIQRGQDIIHGQGLEANEDFSRYTLRRITGTLRMSQDDTLSDE